MKTIRKSPKLPLAAVDISERSLLTLSLAASQIDLIQPETLIFNLPGKGLTLTAFPDPATPPASAWTASETPFDAYSQFKASSGTT